SLVTEASSATEIAFRLCEQRYMELLEAGDYMGALNVLRNRLTPLKFNTGRVHELSTYIMCSDAEELHRISGWPGSLGGDFCHCLDEAVQYQLAKCRYHNTDLPVAEVSLLADHACSRDSAEFPARCGQRLGYLSTETGGGRPAPGRGALLSILPRRPPPGHRCKDGAVFIWRVDDLTLRLSVARRYHIGEERGGVACLAWSPDSRLLLCCAAEDSSDVLVWCVSPPPLLPPASAAAHHHSLLAESHPNGASVVVNSASVLSGGGSSEPQRFSRGGTPEESLTTAAWFPDSLPWQPERTATATRPALAADSFGRVRQYRFDTMQDETLLQEDGSIIAMCLSRDQQVAALNCCQLWPAARLAGPGISQGGYCLHACFGGLTGNFLASGSQDNCAHHHGMLVTASDDCTIRVWLPTGRALSAAATDHGSGGTAATDGSSGQASANLA
uniref:WD_REPEATS_REGION domain-containing protein n=1 Tax=Macrostomum lignano TaxID=282301 RepID=A0A1I8JPX2_9PLAT